MLTLSRSRFFLVLFSPVFHIWRIVSPYGYRVSIVPIVPITLCAYVLRSYIIYGVCMYARMDTWHSDSKHEFNMRATLVSTVSIRPQTSIFSGTRSSRLPYRSQVGMWTRWGRQVRVMLLLGGSTVCSTSHFRSV